MALGFSEKGATVGKDPTTSPVYGGMADKQTKYEALVHALHGDIYRYAYWLCRDPQVAEDLVQETFLRAWKSIDSCSTTRPPRPGSSPYCGGKMHAASSASSLTSSISTSIPRAIRRHCTASRRWRTSGSDATSPARYRISGTPAAAGAGGFSGDEIAAQLGLNKNTVMTRLFRARNQIKEAMESTTQQRGHTNG